MRGTREGRQEVKIVSNSTFILVPMGGNESTHMVLALARRAAARLNATVRILHVSETRLSPQALRDRLGLSDQAIQSCILESAEGANIAEEIVAAAQRMRPRLVVLHAGRPAPEVSDVTLRVLCHLDCPALVVRPGLDLGAHDEGRWLRRILVPLDSSPGSAEAVRRAADLAWRENAILDILHIASSQGLPPSEPGSLPVGLYMDHPHYDLKSWSREFMRRFFHITVGTGDVPTPMLHLSSGDPAEEIIKFAERTGTDLIVSAWQGSLDEGRARIVRELLSRDNCQLLFLVIGRSAEPRPGNFGRTAAA